MSMTVRGAADRASLRARSQCHARGPPGAYTPGGRGRMLDESPEPKAPNLERKVATILSADVAGFSRLMADDEESTLRVFREHTQVFESVVGMHRGRIFNTAGDAILAEFSSVVEAVRCAT